MKKFLLGMTVLAIIVLSACSSIGGTPTPQPTPDTAPAARASDTVVADAWVVPVRWATLSFEVGGPVLAVKVKEGEGVKAGDVLVQLDDSDAASAVTRAEASVALAQAQLAQAKLGPRPAQITDAEYAIEEAKAGVAAAEAQLLQLQTAVRAGDIAAAEAAVAQAGVALKIAQDRFDQAKTNSEERDAADALAIAKQDYTAAQKRLTQLRGGPTKSELEAAQANIAVAQAQQAQAEANLKVVKTGPTQEQIAVAEAGLKQAQAALETAKAQLSKLQLRAPFDGVVVSLNIKTGEMVAPGVPLVWLADLSAWQIETDDLTELSVVRVHEGDPVHIRFDAIPDLELAGRVVRIKALGEDKRGDITYTVIIQPGQHDARLRWNMTASVTIGE
ncbi:MAG: efflux RND transporter periplasmic adaptor subunit [Thermoflexales bacterium]|nr:efflux RND transporter periplasmic adaptor subunit [Thermoflexales bacterium]